MGANKYILLWAIDSLFSRNIWRGLMSYIRPAKPWCLQLVSPLAQIPRNTTGVIACLDKQQHFEKLKKLRIPAVSVADNFATPGMPVVTMDNVAIGRAGARHLLENGYRYFVFAGLAWDWSQRRYEGFRAELYRSGRQCEFLDVTGWVENKRAARPPALEALLPDTAQPLAVMACNDWVAWRLSELCLQLGSGIQDRIALLGVDNDEIICDSVVPSISSIIVPSENVGYQAAAVLDGLINGERPPRRPLLLAPVGVASRASTAPFANMDADVAAAIRFIRERAEKPINVEDILRQVPVTRRSLERKFKKIVGRTPLEEIYRIRIEQAQHLLVRSRLPLSTIARRAGFSSAKRFSTVFKSKTGLTPSQYRADTSESKQSSNP